MNTIELLNKVLQTEALCHPVAQIDQTPQKQCAKPVSTGTSNGTVISARKRLIELITNAVLLESQTNVCIPRELEVQLNAAATGGDVVAGLAAAKAIRDHLVAHEAVENPWRTWQP